MANLVYVAERPRKVYKSPQADMGYDIADYEDIDPSYGTLADVDNLIKEMKKRDMKLVMDLVVNHTSDQVRPGLSFCLRLMLTRPARVVLRLSLFQNVIEA